MLYPNLVTLGSITGGATQIQADVSQGLGSAVAVKVTLTTDYSLANPRPPGFPFRPGMTGVDAADVDYPRVLHSGLTIALLACEANALVAASAATLA